MSLRSREVLLVHSSDVHVDDSRGAAVLRAVLATARMLQADVVLLAGDTFENNQLSAAVLDNAGNLLAEAGMPTVMLPGNHDLALPDSVFFRHGLATIPNVNILGVTHQEAVAFPAYDLEIWGHAHRDYFDLAPLRGPRPRSTRSASPARFGSCTRSNRSRYPEWTERIAIRNDRCTTCHFRRLRHPLRWPLRCE